MKPARKPDLKAPRFRVPVQHTLTKAFYDELRTTYPELNHLTDQEIKKIIYTLNGMFWEKAISYRDGIELPAQMGYVFIGTCPPKVHKNVDFKTSADYLAVIQHRNWESDRFLAKIFYTNFETKYHFRNHELWGFEATRQFKRTMSKAYIQNWKMYIQVDHTQKISRLFRKEKAKQYNQKKKQEALENYDELSL